ncbi:Polyisoprenoid-binding protein YceI [Amycolatopsis arida]|uniref:Polyisoprenoid-binding protein YceI n=1 Tax=Amycolatopsis arida TaxID=587909 RepID=A0A1I5Z7J4_9PSEU|nr:YceI family protein [Amycolatopsis arida]TDX90179.1 polyisoprenoid-binding protein YceI [Amycolatopsis arida]SFQ52067.1 Polyisoprenoid-binding protein YceI [Amycolatopsis arida]
MTTATTQIPGYLAGTWDIDPVHSDVSFTVRHLGVSKVRGSFGEFSGEITTAESITDSTVIATIQAAGIDTNNEQRDGHVRSADFLDVERFPTLTFRSTGIRVDGEDYLIDGELTVRGVTRPVTLTTELGGFGDGMTEGSKVLGVSASTEISRSDFGVGASIPTAVVSDKIRIELNIEASLRS